VLVVVLENVKFRKIVGWYVNNCFISLSIFRSLNLGIKKGLKDNGSREKLLVSGLLVAEFHESLVAI
jgi:hypothetical protein